MGLFLFPKILYFAERFCYLQTDSAIYRLELLMKTLTALQRTTRKGDHYRAVLYYIGGDSTDATAAAYTIPPCVFSALDLSTIFPNTIDNAVPTGVKIIV